MKIFIIFLGTIFFVNNLLGQIWEEPPLHRLTSEEYSQTLKYWGNKYNDILTVEDIGISDGERIYLLKITNPNSPDNHKQVALITAMHGGPERSGTTSVMHLIEWMLSNDPQAIETRKKQVILLIPIILPKSFFKTDAFHNAFGIDPYTGGGIDNWDLNSLTYLKPRESPEVMAFLNVVDKYKPDVHLDLHGTGVQAYSELQKKDGEHRRFSGQTMFEITGMAYSNSLLRPWDWRITEKMIDAGERAGYPSDRAEADAQQMLWGPSMNPVSGKVWRGRPLFYTAQYSYLKYHTLIACLEVGWEESGVERSKGLLQIGNEVWDGEDRTGYPVNRVFPVLGKYITSYGNNAAELRESRVELWAAQNNFSGGHLYPEVEGRESLIVGVSQKGNQMLNNDLEIFIKGIKGNNLIDAQAIEEFITTGPQIRLEFAKAKISDIQNKKIIHGMGLRIRIPYQSASIKNVMLNGHRLAQSSTDGYDSWVGNGYLQLQVNIPPDKMEDLDIVIVNCEYDPGVKRSYGWTPPIEVLEYLEKK